MGKSITSILCKALVLTLLVSLLVAPAAVAETAEEPITITVMTLWAEDNTENIATSIRQRLRLFQEENPNVIIQE